MARSLLGAVAALAAVAFAPTAAQAVTFNGVYTFDFSNAYIDSSSGNQNTAGNSITFRSTTDAALKVKVTAWSINQGRNETNNSNDTVTQATLKLWDGGLGVKNMYEEDTQPNHAIDNGMGTRQNPNTEYNDTRYMVDFVMMQFNWDVDVNSMTTGWASGDWDASLRVGAGNPGAWNGSLGLNGANVFGSSNNGSIELSDYVNIADASLNSSGPLTPYSRNVNSNDQHGMMWMIGALYGTEDDDFFKLDMLNVSVFPTVPEPSTWMTMILGFGFVGSTMRRRKSLAGKRTAALA